MNVSSNVMVQWLISSFNKGQILALHLYCFQRHSFLLQNIQFCIFFDLLKLWKVDNSFDNVDENLLLSIDRYAKKN